MPIDIQPTATGQKMMNKKMDKIGGGGMDIPMMKKKMNMSGKMEDMREYMDILDGIEEVKYFLLIVFPLLSYKVASA